MATPRAYWLIGKNTLQLILTYRLNLLLEFIGVLIFQFVVLLFWHTVAQARGGVGDFSISEITTYMFLSAITGSLILLVAQGDDITREIKMGDLSGFLTKPISPLLRWFARDLTRRSLTLLIGLIGSLPVFLWFRSSILPPQDETSFVLFLISLAIGVALHFLLFTFFALWAFWAEETWGQRFVLRVLMEVATGAIIPLSFIPGIIGQTLQFLPFKYFAFIPNQIYLGKLTGTTALSELATGLLWIIVFALAVAWAWQAGIRYYRAVGG